MKLDSQNAGLYKILKMKDHSYVVDLSSYMKMNNIFHADYLQKISNNLLSSQMQEPESLIEVNSKSEYTVKKVLSSHIHNNVLQYKIHWSGCDSDNQ